MKIIRTVQELKALDTETVVQQPPYLPGQWLRPETAGTLAYLVSRNPWGKNYLPAVVIATGEQVRAARTALGECGLTSLLGAEGGVTWQKGAE